MTILISSNFAEAQEIIFILRSWIRSEIKSPYMLTISAQAQILLSNAHILRKSKLNLKDGSFNLRKSRSNSEKFEELIYENILRIRG